MRRHQKLGKRTNEGHQLTGTKVLFPVVPAPMHILQMCRTGDNSPKGILHNRNRRGRNQLWSLEDKWAGGPNLRQVH